MSQVRAVVSSLVMTFLVSAVFTVPAGAQEAQRNLRPPAKNGLLIVPFMEGWYSNEDGSVTVSYGYENRNENEVIIPKGADNFIEPAQFDGMQPEVYFPGRHMGVFAITIPASMVTEKAWWHLKTGSWEETKVPGERGVSAYELDRNPRPQGSVQPLIWFEEGNPGRGPEGVVATTVETVAVGAPLKMEVETSDPSIRDRSNPVFAKPLDSRVMWYQHQGPGDVRFTEDPSTPFMTTPDTSLRNAMPASPARIEIPESKGRARVIATFSEPGEYIIRARVDNWNASDSDGFDQCCWSNAYQRVHVTP